MRQQRHKRPTKLEDAQWRLHLDVDGNNEEVLNKAMQQVRLLVQMVIGQDEIESHDVTLAVQVTIQDRNKLRGEQRVEADRIMGRDVGVGQRI